MAVAPAVAEAPPCGPPATACARAGTDPVTATDVPQARWDEISLLAALAGATCLTQAASARPAQAGSRKNAVALAVVRAAVSAGSSPRSRASSRTMCARYIGSLRRSLGIGVSVRGSR